VLLIGKPVPTFPEALYSPDGGTVTTIASPPGIIGVTALNDGSPESSG
jgi:hypothetical protein